MATDLQASPPICVDLDGTLVRTDTLWECLIAAWRKDFRLVSFFRYGSCADALISNTKPRDTPTSMWTPSPMMQSWSTGWRTARPRPPHPARDGLLGRGREQSPAGARLRFPRYPSTKTLNLSGQNKLKALQDHFQGQKFEYIGDSSADVPIWSYLGKAHTRGASKQFCARLESKGIEMVSRGRHRSLDLR